MTPVAVPDGVDATHAFLVTPTKDASGEVEITITGQAVSDPAVQRTLTSRVRLRNDLLTLSVPGVGPGNFVPCPNP